MADREPIGKRLRFEVFKRDKFTCQYCGRAAPDVTLHVDHVEPVAAGGETTLLNLVTACADCNLGKGPRALSDDSVVVKQRSQLDHLQERREQVEMMIAWQRGLVAEAHDALGELAAFWNDLISGYAINEFGKDLLRKWARTFTAEQLCEAMRTAADNHLLHDSSGNLDAHSVQAAFDAVPRIAGANRTVAEKPYFKALYYVRACLRRRCGYMNEGLALKMLDEAYLDGVPINELKDMAICARSWSDWRAMMDAFRADEQKGE